MAGLQQIVGPRGLLVIFVDTRKIPGEDATSLCMYWQFVNGLVL